MLQELILLFGLAALPAAFSYFLDYCLGRPGADTPNGQAIFYGYTHRLALGRVRRENRLAGLLQAFGAQLNSDSPDTRKDGERQWKLAVLLTAQPLFGWEQLAGMCIFCTNFWLSLIAGGVMFVTVPLQFFHPALFFWIIPIISHLILRKI